MVAGNGKEMRDSHVFTPKMQNGVKPFDILRSAVIYGPNAGGKSNFFNALGNMEEIVRDSNKNNESIHRLAPFLLSNKTNKSPSVFEVVMIIDGIRYQYGFSTTKERIHAEWLFAFPKGKPQKWFERDYNKKTKEYDYNLGDSLKGQKDVWRKSTRPNALFLSTAVQLNSTQLQHIYDWFEKSVWFINAGAVPTHFAMKHCKEQGSKKIIDFLKAADFTIEGIEIKEEEFSPESIPKGTPEPLANFIKEEMKGKKQLDAETRHKTEEGGLVNMPLHSESDGTQRMLALAVPILEALEEGRILVVDELNQKLHPILMRFLISLFNNRKVNKKNAQLIFTTHAVSLLKQDIFRR
ncbi:MAG: ATP-binding protein, partial [Proteobacteria bacterium]|nr:ATP-binding protein [Pseudomonadota bacterium]